MRKTSSNMKSWMFVCFVSSIGPVLGTLIGAGAAYALAVLFHKALDTLG